MVADIKGAVYLLPLQAGEQFIIPVPLHQLDGGAGKLGVKLLQQRGQPGGSDAGQSADAQRAALLGGGCHPKFVLFGLDLLHDAQQFRSRWGKGDPLPFPAEKLYPQFLFQIGGEVA